ncbi:SdrD B-like domain-containing protein [Deinococcus sp.]|uniref:SdrD B-like domain-containing protein n=1 Tax=Deinococcus sp. TaxID=47478 RepID=UPI0025FE1592|nr:SdrD B-like domain-containing protein [Deinococcus sp.]
MKARLTLLRLTLACAALPCSLAAAAGTTSTICQDQGGILDSVNLITAENAGSFGSQGGTYRDLESADQPGTPYSYAGNDPNTGRQAQGLLVPEGKYLVLSSQGGGNGKINSFGPWQAYTGHTSGAANDAYLAVNGFTSEATFLKQTVPVEPNTNYEIGVWARSPHAANSPFGDLASAPKLSIQAGAQASGVTDPLVRGDLWERGSVIFNSGNSSSIPVTLKNVSTVVQGNDFYVDDLFVRKCTLPSGTVSGKVFRDNDGNASQNGEPGIGGATVTVTDKNGSVATTTTAADGTYTFPNLPLNNGPYTVAVDGAKSASQLAGLSASTPTSTANVKPIANQTVPGGNFGYKPPATVPDTGVCTADKPYVQSFDKPGPQAGITNVYAYNADPNVVTATDATYNMWNAIDHTGNGGYALFMNIASYEGNNGAVLNNPGVLYESRITVPAGSTINYQNYVRSHSNGGTQLQFRFLDGVSGAELQRADGAPSTTGYVLQTVPAFVSPSSSLVLRIYTLRDGTVQDINALKLDDLKLTCTPPQPPQPVVDKTVQNITANGPVTKETTGKPGDVLEYCITATNTGGSNATKLGLGDNIPNSSQALPGNLPGGYGAGKDIKFTGPDLVVKYLTFAADADTGQLLPAVLNPPAAPRIVVSDPALKLSVGQKFQVCFRTTIN